MAGRDPSTPSAFLAALSRLAQGLANSWHPTNMWPAAREAALLGAPQPYCPRLTARLSGQDSSEEGSTP